jgi:CopG-like RHH_1 or ribbon-helix-helix domain, RHH_5
MKNVTITLPERLYSRLRVKAASRRVSMSKLVSTTIEESLRIRELQEETLKSFLSGPKWPLSDGAGRFGAEDEMYGSPRPR